MKTCDFLWKYTMIWSFYERIGSSQKFNSEFLCSIYMSSLGDQIPNFPLTLHWNQKYLKSQDTNSVSLHLKLLPLTFPRRQKQCLRKSIDSLDNRCPWLDWQVILKVTGLYLLHLHQKCTWPTNIVNLNFSRWLFLGSHLGHVEVMWPAQGCFLT